MKRRSLGSGCASRAAAFDKLLGSSVALLGLNLAIVQPAQAVTINFEELDITTSGSFGVDLLSSKGYDFANPGSRVGISADDQPNVPNSGSQTLVADSQVSLVLMSRTDGTPFSLVELLIAEGRNTTTGFFRFSATSVSIVGTLAEGGTVHTTFNLDLFAQESPDDFELLTLSGFNDVLSVTFTGLGGSSGSSFALDDILVIPEPSTALLLGLGLAGLRVRRRQRPR
jgi:hypothetical protein